MLSDVPDAHEALMQFLYQAPVGLVQISPDGTVEMMNPMAASLLMPLSRTGDLDNLFVTLEMVAPQLRGLAANFALPSGVVCEAVRIPLAVESRDPSRPAVLSVSLVKLDGTRLMAMVNDVTTEVRREQLELARRLNDVGLTDRLTQMPNRTAVRDKIQQVLDHGAAESHYTFAVLFMNCDRFTQINDRLGHAVGDEVLGLVADRLRFAVRQRNQAGRAGASAETAARVGSDEFVVFLNNLRASDDVLNVAQRLLSSLGKPYVVGTHQLHCNVSMGIVLQRGAPGDADVLLQNASIAMMEAKQLGGACYVVFEPDMHARAARVGAIEAGLRRALAERELFLVYQPVVDLQAEQGVGGCASVEALVRWQHPSWGVVSPLEFIGAAERCGLIGEIGELVLETACRQFVLWQVQLGARAPRRLAVNLSRGQLSRAGYIDALIGILASTGMAPQQLQLEVTETLAAQDEAIQMRLQELKSVGLTLALDDFGTGYSSLASLHQLPVDTLKIDRSFVTQADTSRHHQVLIEATVMVAHSLGMSVVAEGIETAAQAAVVRELGCEKGQGYFFSKPLSAADLAAWVSRDGAPAGEVGDRPLAGGQDRRPGVPIP